MLVHDIGDDNINNAQIRDRNSAAPKKGIYLVSVGWLKPHEAFIPARFQEVLSEIVEFGGYRYPILADLRSGVILDGHHRYQVSLHLGLARVPAILIDYLNDARVKVQRWIDAERHWVSSG